MRHIVDSHVDTPSQLLRLRDIGIDNRYGHVDFPKLRRGGVAGSFFALYTPPGMAPDAATRYALEMVAAVDDCVAARPDQAALSLQPDDVARNQAAGKVSIFLGMENGAPFQESLPLLRLFHRLGVRYVTLTHNGDNALADSAAEGKRWHGLSPFGRRAVAEMNALGVMVDLSHSSDETFWDCIEVSRAPVIASHSCCRALCPHRRNLTDDMLRAIGEKDGYVGINFYPAFLVDGFGRDPDEAALLEEGDRVEAAFIAAPDHPERVADWHRMQDRLLSLHRPGVREVVDHIDHAVRMAGIDHVGIGTDYDGILVAPEGLEDVSCVGKVFDEMARRGYSERDIEKVAGENLLRVFNKVISISKSIY